MFISAVSLEYLSIFCKSFSNLFDCNISFLLMRTFVIKRSLSFLSSDLLFLNLNWYLLTKNKTINDKISKKKNQNVKNNPCFTVTIKEYESKINNAINFSIEVANISAHLSLQFSKIAIIFQTQIFSTSLLSI
jgi:hypothetical protein